MLVELVLGGKIREKVSNEHKKQAAENLDDLFPFRGDGGSRTLVQTRNPQAFYMLIPLLVFVPRKGTNALNATLSPKFRHAVGAPTRLSRNCLAPRAQAGIRNLHLRDVSSTHLVSGLSQ